MEQEYGKSDKEILDLVDVLRQVQELRTKIIPLLEIELNIPWYIELWHILTLKVNPFIELYNQLYITERFIIKYKILK